MNPTVIKVAAVAGIAYVFRSTLIAQWNALTGSTTAAAATTTTTTTTDTTTPAPPAPANSQTRAKLAAIATANGYTAAAPLNVDQWNYYLARIGTSTGADAVQMDAMIAATGGDRSVNISLDTFLSAATAAGVFPSGLSGLPIVPVTADLIRAAAASPQTANLLGARVYLPGEAWSQLYMRQTGRRPAIQPAGGPMTAKTFHVMRGR